MVVGPGGLIGCVGGEGEEEVEVVVGVGVGGPGGVGGGYCCCLGVEGHCCFWGVVGDGSWEGGWEDMMGWGEGGRLWGVGKWNKYNGI